MAFQMTVPVENSDSLKSFRRAFLSKRCNTGANNHTDPDQELANHDYLKTTDPALQKLLECVRIFFRIDILL